ncbi:protein of unknown function (plasmid) [Caballeronia sp. S22]
MLTGFWRARRIEAALRSREEQGSLHRMFGIVGRLQGGVTATTGVFGSSAGGQVTRQALDASSCREEEKQLGNLRSKGHQKCPACGGFRSSSRVAIA